MAMNVSEYWIISAPGDKTCQQTWDRMNAATMKQQLSSNWKFHIPDLKVGTLDQLVGLSDDLGKWMVIYFMRNVVNRDRASLREHTRDETVSVADEVVNYHLPLFKFLFCPPLIYSKGRQLRGTSFSQF